MNCDTPHLSGERLPRIGKKAVESYKPKKSGQCKYSHVVEQRVKRNRVFVVIVVSAFDLALRVIEISASTTWFVCALHFRSLRSQNRTKPADAIVPQRTAIPLQRTLSGVAVRCGLG